MFRTSIAVVAVMAVSLTACQSGDVPNMSTASETTLPSPAEMARDAELRGDWETAAKYWQSEAMRAPDDFDVRLSLARSLRLSNACGRAAPHLEFLRGAKPQYLDVMLETGKCHFVSGRFDAAAEVLGAAEKAHPSSWEVQTVLATTLDHMERSQQALKHHERAVELAPANAIALSNKAISIALGGDLQTALKLMREATALPNAPSRVRTNLAVLEAIAGNGDVAAMMARQEIGADDESIKLLQRIAEAARNNGK